MRENKLLCSYLATRRLLLTHCLAPPACEELPNGPAAFNTRGGEEEGTRKDIAAILPQSLNKNFCCGVEEQDCLSLATETSWLFDDSSNAILRSGRGRGGHLADSFTGFMNYDRGSLASLDLSPAGSQNTVFFLFHNEQEETATHRFIPIVTGFPYLGFNPVQFHLQAQLVFLQVIVVVHSNFQGSF